MTNNQKIIIFGMIIGLAIVLQFTNTNDDSFVLNAILTMAVGLIGLGIDTSKKE